MVWVIFMAFWPCFHEISWDFPWFSQVCSSETCGGCDLHHRVCLRSASCALAARGCIKTDGFKYGLFKLFPSLYRYHADPNSPNTFQGDWSHCDGSELVLPVDSLCDLQHLVQCSALRRGLNSSHKTHFDTFWHVFLMSLCDLSILFIHFYVSFSGRLCIWSTGPLTSKRPAAMTRSPAGELGRHPGRPCNPKDLCWNLLARSPRSSH